MTLLSVVGFVVVQPVVASTVAETSTHYENTPIQIYRKFHVRKPKIFK